MTACGPCWPWRTTPTRTSACRRTRPWRPSRRMTPSASSRRAHRRRASSTCSAGTARTPSFWSGSSGTGRSGRDAAPPGRERRRRRAGGADRQPGAPDPAAGAHRGVARQSRADARRTAPPQRAPGGVLREGGAPAGAGAAAPRGGRKALPPGSRRHRVRGRRRGGGRVGRGPAGDPGRDFGRGGVQPGQPRRRYSGASRS